MPAAVRLDAFGLVAADFTDPEHERLIMVAVGGLIVLGLAMLAITIVWWRGTRSEHEALAPLEVMGERSWMKATFSERRRRLDSVRPPTSDRFLGSAFPGDELDLRAARKAAPAGFDDLREHPLVLPDDEPAVAVEAALPGEPAVPSSGSSGDDTAAAVREPPVATEGPPDDTVRVGDEARTDHDPEDASARAHDSDGNGGRAISGAIDPLLRGSSNAG